MAVIAGWASLGLKDVVTGTVDLNEDTFGFMLMTGYAFNQDTHRYRSDVTGELATGSGYTYGGATLTGNTVSYDASSNEIRWDFNDPSFTSASFSASQAAVFKRRGGTSSADELLMYIEFGGTQTVSSGTFTYQVPSTGAGYVLVSAPA